MTRVVFPDRLFKRVVKNKHYNDSSSVFSIDTYYKLANGKYVLKVKMSGFPRINIEQRKLIVMSLKTTKMFIENKSVNDIYILEQIVTKDGKYTLLVNRLAATLKFFLFKVNDSDSSLYGNTIIEISYLRQSDTILNFSKAYFTKPIDTNELRIFIKLLLRASNLL